MHELGKTIFRDGHISSSGFLFNVDLEKSLLEYFVDNAIKGISLIHSERGRDISKEITEKLLQHNLSLNELLDNYCLLTTAVNDELYQIDLSFPKMKALIAGGLEKFLTHETMRLIKKAAVTLAYEGLLHEDFFKKIPSGEKIRIISNGRESIAFQE